MTNPHDIHLEDLKTGDHDGVAERIESAYTQDQDGKLPWVLEWERNARMLEGQQWIRVNQAVNRVEGIPQPSRNRGYGFMPRPVSNYILKNARSRISQYVSMLPLGKVRPRSSDPEEQQTARIAEASRAALWKLGKETRNYIDIAVWLTVCGVAFRKDYVSRAEVDRYRFTFSEDGEEVYLDAEGNPLEIEDEEGEEADFPFSIQAAVLSPFEVSFDPYAPRFDKSRWVMDYGVRPLDWIRQMYDVDEPGYTGEATRVEDEGLKENHGLAALMRLRTSAGRTFMGNYSGVPDVENAAVVKSYYEAPTEDHPRGRHFVVANGRTLFADDNPFMPLFWNPYTMFSELPFPGRVYPISVISQSVPLQRRINAIDAFRMLVRRKLLAPRVFLPKGHGIPRGQMSGDVGLITEYNASAGGSPVFQQIQPIGAELESERQAAIEDMAEIYGAQKVETGQAPGKAYNYAAIALIAEKAEGTHAVGKTLFVEGVLESETKKLQLLQMFMEEPDERFSKELISRLSNVPRDILMAFKGSTIEGATDVVLEAVPSFGTSTVMKREVVKEFLAAGWIPPQVLQDPIFQGRLFDLFDIPEFAGVESDDVVRAQMENAYYLDGEPLAEKRNMRTDADNDMIHIRIHQGAQKAPGYLDRPEGERMALQQHINDHMAAHQRKMQQNPASAIGAQVQGDVQSGNTVATAQGGQQSVTAGLAGVG